MGLGEGWPAPSRNPKPVVQGQGRAPPRPLMASPGTHAKGGVGDWEWEGVREALDRPPAFLPAGPGP